MQLNSSEVDLGFSELPQSTTSSVSTEATLTRSVSASSLVRLESSNDHLETIDDQDFESDSSMSETDRLSALYPNAGYDFYGTPSGALCVYKTGQAWPVRTGLESQRIIREARGVHGHAMQPTWPDVGRRICSILGDQGVNWTSLDCFAFAETGKKIFTPLLLSIGVQPRSLAYELANTVADSITYFLNQSGFSGFEIGFRESVVTQSIKLCSFDPLIDPCSKFRQPLTPTLGISIAPLSTPYYEGTGALYFRESASSQRVFLLTCAHVARPLTALSNGGPIRKKKSHPREKIIVCGSSAYAQTVGNTTEAIKMDELEIKERTNALGRLAERMGQEEDPRYTRSREEHMEAMREAETHKAEVEACQVDLVRRWNMPQDRVIGQVIHVEPIKFNVQPRGYTRDWAIIEIANSKVEWSMFPGNKVYIGGNLSSQEWNKYMFPNAEDQVDYNYPDDGLLQAYGIVPLEEITHPKQLDAHGEPCLFVVKHGMSTGTTLGRTTGMMSFRRNVSACDLHDVSMEIAVLPYGYANGPFSASGDSGSIVLDRKGRIIGMLTGGAGTSDRTDVTYVTPYSFLDEEIKRHFPDSFLYEVV